MSKPQKGFGFLPVVLILLLIGTAVGVGWYVWQENESNNKFIKDQSSTFWAADYNGKIIYYRLSDKKTTSISLPITNPENSDVRTSILGDFVSTSIRTNNPIQISSNGEVVVYATADCKGLGEECDVTKTRLSLYANNESQELVAYDSASNKSEGFTQSISNFILSPDGSSVTYLVRHTAIDDKDTSWDLHELKISDKSDVLVSSGLNNLERSSYDTGMYWASDGAVRFFAGLPDANSSIKEFRYMDGKLNEKVFGLPECDFVNKHCNIAHPYSLSPDGKSLLITYSTDNNINENTKWGILKLNLGSGEVSNLDGFTGQPNAIYWSPNSTDIAFSELAYSDINNSSIGAATRRLNVSNGQSETVYDAGTPTITSEDEFSPPKYFTYPVGWSPEGMFLALENDGKLKIYSFKEKSMIETGIDLANINPGGWISN